MQIKSKGSLISPIQSAQTLAHEHRGPTLIATLKMELSDSDLKNGLQHDPHRSSRLMPELFQGIVTVIPIASIEQPHRLMEAGVTQQ